VTITAHRAAFETAIRDVWEDTVSVYEYVQSVTQVPAIVITPAREPTITPNGGFGHGSARYYYDLICMAPQTESTSNQMTLDELVDPQVNKSVPWIISHNPTLGGLVQASSWLRVDNYGGEFKSAQVDHIGALVRVEIQTCL
jgi:hypothetical protein